MKFGKKSIGAITAGLSLVMALAPVAPALADNAPNLNGADGVKVTKVMEANSGSTFEKTFTFHAEPKQLTGDSAAELNNTPRVADVSITSSEAGSKVSTDAFDFAGKTYSHAGVYGYTVQEVRTEGDTHLRADQRDLMTYDNSVYTVYVWVVNKQGGGTEVNAVTAVKNAASDAVPAEGTAKATDLTFDNKYYEYGNPDNPDGNNGVDLKVDKTVTGTQGNKTAKWTFKVTFDDSALTVKPETNTIQYQIVKTGSAPDANKWVDVPANGEYELTHDQQILFKNVIAGTKYTVAETNKDASYTTTGEVSNVVASDSSTKPNSVTVDNHKDQTVVTGVIMNNAPFIVMIGAAAAGVAAYGSAKRKLEK